jgi:dTDP-glucose 4,6-dehydratase
LGRGELCRRIARRPQIVDPSAFLQTNINDVQVLLQASRKYRVERFVQISTDEVYGDTDGQEPSSEESPLAPSSPYAASKAAADFLCLSYRRTYGLPVLITRSSNNYGPFQFPKKLIPLIIRDALNGEDLPVYGDGLQRRDWLYVEDNARAIFQTLERGMLGSCYNIGAGPLWLRPTQILTTFQLCCNFLFQSEA